MKICLNVANPITGYKNLGFVKNVDAFAENGECDEVYSDDILNYIHYSQVANFVTHLAKKVRHGGTIVFGGNDSVELSKMFLRGDFNLEDFNRIIYGEPNTRPRESAVSLNVVTNILQSLGFKILKKRLIGYTFIIEAQRPEVKHND